MLKKLKQQNNYYKFRITRGSDFTAEPTKQFMPALIIHQELLRYLQNIVSKASLCYEFTNNKTGVEKTKKLHDILATMMSSGSVAHLGKTMLGFFAVSTLALCYYDDARGEFAAKFC